jgi:glutathione S-transferase
MEPSSEVEVQGIRKDMADAMKPVVALLQQTKRERWVYFEGEEPGFADFVLVGFLAWFERVDKRVWEAVIGHKEIMGVWMGIKNHSFRGMKREIWA